MTDFLLREVRAGDAEELARGLRIEDRRELLRWDGNDPLYAIRQGLKVCPVNYAGCLPDGRLLCLIGAKRFSALDRSGAIWELGTDLINTHRLAFMHGARTGFDLLARSFPDVERFFNFVDTEYTGAVRWLGWLGAAFGEEMPGRHGGMFRRFELPNPHYRKGASECLDA